MIDPQRDLIETIRAENLNVYRASPARLREDVGSEAEIAHDYQGRLIFELLQNADDAMAEGSGGISDRIRFRLTDNELLVMNSGRALTEADVRGLTATGASSKTGSSGPRRASIGHKGMGFKSILEITDRPEVFSTTFAFVLDAGPAHAAVSEVLAEFGQEPPQRVPIMRFPWNLEAPQKDWATAQRDGFNVLFRFPFKSGIDRGKVSNLAEALLTLPATTILFLKHLEIVEIEIEISSRDERISWTLRREQADDHGGWEPATGLAKSGVYQVWIESNGADDIWCFLLGHEADIPIGPHRGGLNSYAWEGVELTEVTVAALATGGDNDELPAAWRRFHVFLPTAETSPYPLLVNGAFATDLSRQEIRVAAETEDYNHFLIGSAARVLRERLLPAIQSQGGGITAALRLLERDAQQVTLLNAQSPAQEFHRAVIAALGQVALVPIGGGGLAPVGNLAIPATFGHPSIGSELRGLLTADAKADGRPLPVADLCSAPFAGILADHGAHLLSPAETADLLAHTDPAQTRLTGHATTKLSIDPVLEILQTMWMSADNASRDELERAVRSSPLFPVAKRPDGTIERIAVGDTETFFPPRASHGSIPLQGLRFMLQDLCWGTLTPRERTDVLRAQMPAWIALFQIREFKFPDVMRVSVLPSLALEADPQRRDDLANWNTLAAVCQLAGPTPNPDAPLPYGRLGSQRALTPLCRIPVPCIVNGEERWVPAYRAYFGETWVADASVEPLIEAAGRADPALHLDLPVLVGPDRFVAHLDRLRGLEAAVQDGDEDGDDDNADDDEVDLDEDEERATELDAKERWLAFLTWLGVNHFLRPVHFHDAEDRAKGWISTRGLDRPSGWAFKSLGSIWDDYSNQLRDRLTASPDAADGDRYFYRLHDLEHLGRLTALAASDASGGVASTLFGHLAKNWSRLERFSEVELAILAPGTQPGRRVDPPRADAKELNHFGPDLWLFRLQRASFCPTGHGPRRPELTWWRSSEVERRFDRRGSSADMFLPVLNEAASIPANEAKRFAQAVGVRVELTPAVFTISDALAFVQRIEDLFDEHAAELTPEQLRNQIHPAYQNLFELLSGSATARVAPNDLEALKQTRLLVHDGHGQHHFAIASKVLYATRNGLREILGIEGELWTFVLEGRPAVRAPLQRLFGARSLDDVLNWRPQTDEPSLHGPVLELFRNGLLEVAPFLLARLRAERAEEEQSKRDAGLIREFIDKVEPVRHLTASCTLDGLQLVAGGDRQAFVEHTSDGVVAFVRWGENPWPPDPSEAEALATGIADLLGVGYFEPLLALLTADPSGRARLLHLAGASGNLDPARVAITDQETTDVSSPPGPVLPPPTEGETVDDSERTTNNAGVPGASARVRLVELAALGFDGQWIIETGEPSSDICRDRGHHTHSSRGGPQRASAYGGGTDLNELDRLGMHIAAVFEKRRLTCDGLSATIFDADEPLPTDAIFDVSTAPAVALAAELSDRFKRALATLEHRGIAADVPGFDILTLDQRADDDIGRLIELKSSGVSAHTQAMTWNEWKTAGHADLRAHFYLYLVGNLRADIDTPPFIRTICDPFGELRSTEQTNRTLRRSVQLDVTAFRQAEFQELTVRAADSSG
jgi:hypothetical protein